MMRVLRNIGPLGYWGLNWGGATFSGLGRREGRDQGRPTEDRPGSDPGPGGRGHVATLAELPPAELKGVDSILAARLAGGRWRPALAQRVLCSRAAAASASA